MLHPTKIHNRHPRQNLNSHRQVHFHITEIFGQRLALIIGSRTFVMLSRHLIGSPIKFFRDPVCVDRRGRYILDRQLYSPSEVGTEVGCQSAALCLFQAWSSTETRDTRIDDMIWTTFRV